MALVWTGEIKAKHSRNSWTNHILQVPCTKLTAVFSVVNECKTKQHDCDPRAMCRDEAVGYSCHCPFGFADVSPNSTHPGRVCIQREFCRDRLPNPLAGWSFYRNCVSLMYGGVRPYQDSKVAPLNSSGTFETTQVALDRQTHSLKSIH